MSSQTSDYQTAAINGYVVGLLGYSKNLIIEFRRSLKRRQEFIKKRRLNDPTPKNYNILQDIPGI